MAGQRLRACKQLELARLCGVLNGLGGWPARRKSRGGSPKGACDGRVKNRGCCGNLGKMRPRPPLLGPRLQPSRWETLRRRGQGNPGPVPNAGLGTQAGRTKDHEFNLCFQIRIMVTVLALAWCARPVPVGRARSRCATITISLAG